MGDKNMTYKNYRIDIIEDEITVVKDGIRVLQEQLENGIEGFEEKLEMLHIELRDLEHDLVNTEEASIDDLRYDLT